MLEKEVERKLKKQIEASCPGALCLKFESPGFTGVPDRMILLPGGNVVFAELKAPGKKERRLQSHVQGRLREMGFTVFSSVDNEGRIMDVVERCREVYHAKRI